MSRSLARKIATISALTAWAVLGSTRARAEDALGDKRVTQVSVQKNDIAGAVLALALDTGVPIGVEVLAGPGEEFDVTAAGSTLGTELNKLVRNDPRYQWKQIGKAIDIFPKDEPDFVFDVPVDHFESKDGFPVQMIQELLRDPAVAARLAKAKVTAGTWVAGSASRQRASVNIEKATFRRASTTSWSRWAVRAGPHFISARQTSTTFGFNYGSWSAPEARVFEEPENL